MVASCDVKFPIRLEGLAFAHAPFSSVSALCSQVIILRCLSCAYQVSAQKALLISAITVASRWVAGTHILAYCPYPCSLKCYSESCLAVVTRVVNKLFSCAAASSFARQALVSAECFGAHQVAPSLSHSATAV